jgi:hypothetical protein
MIDQDRQGNIFDIPPIYDSPEVVDSEMTKVREPHTPCNVSDLSIVNKKLSLCGVSKTLPPSLLQRRRERRRGAATPFLCESSIVY